jgi:uncharacterized protein YukE
VAPSPRSAAPQDAPDALASARTKDGRVIWIAGTRDADSAEDRYVSPWLVDEFVDSYSGWRQESVAVRNAYETYSGQTGADRTLAFMAYQAALDREERAARAYQECAERIAGRAR